MIVTPRAAEETTMRTIKRYSNRKLYDTEDKRYITLDQIAALIRDGRDVKVVDNQTGEDLTTVTLSQILLEQEKRKEAPLPKSFFVSLIQRSAASVVDFTRKSVLSWFDASFASEGEIEENVDEMARAGEISQDDARKLKDEIKSRAASFKKRLDDAVERRVHDVLAHLNIPTKADIARLSDRLDVVTRKFEALLAEETATAGEKKTRG
jgi:polyhydroxyalkanoate synthesis repressor PhaR